MLCQIVLRKLSNETLAIYYLLFDANGRMQSCQADSRQEVTLDCFFLSPGHCTISSRTATCNPRASC